MKKLTALVLVIMLNLAILGNSFAYHLSDSDKKSADNIVLKLESFISKKWENYRNTLAEKIKKIDTSKSKKLEAYVDYIVWYLYENSLDNKKSIFKKIEDDLKKKEAESQSWIQKEIKNVLIQWDFKAEYISNNWDYTKSDKIKITQNWKNWEIPWVYNLEDKSEENQSKIKCVANLEEKYKKDRMSWIWSCWFPYFTDFLEFSPSWYYLSINFGWWELSPFQLLDVKTWKSILNSYNINFSSWTKDKSQFIYWQIWRVWEVWLYITEKWNFPKIKKLLEDDEVYWWYIDEKNIYVKVWSIDIDPKTWWWNDKEYYKVIEIDTWKIIYSQEITK